METVDLAPSTGVLLRRVVGTVATEQERGVPRLFAVLVLGTAFARQLLLAGELAPTERREP